MAMNSPQSWKRAISVRSTSRLVGAHGERRRHDRGRLTRAADDTRAEGRPTGATGYHCRHTRHPRKTRRLETPCREPL
jgi:hypothetical protein